MGTLRELTVQPVTKARYAQARESFYTYLREHHIILPTQAAALDCSWRLFGTSVGLRSWANGRFQNPGRITGRSAKTQRKVG